MDASFITVLIGNIGVPVAALFAAIGYLYKNRRERAKSTKKVLYLMLELRHAIMVSAINPRKATEEYFRNSFSTSKKYGLNFEDSDLSENLRLMVGHHIENLILAQQVNIETLIPSIDLALLDMATEKPLLAFQLRGREKIGKLISHTQDYQTIVKDNFISEVKPEIFQLSLLEILEEMIVSSRKDICQLLDNDVLLLAKEVGALRKCQNLLKSSINLDSPYDFKEMEKVIEKVFNKLVETMRVNPMQNSETTPIAQSGNASLTERQ